MCKLFLTRLLIVAAVVFGVSSAYSAERTVTIDAVFNKSVFDASAFGSTLDSLPVNLTLVVEDSDTGILNLAPGTQIDSDGSVILAGATLVPASAVVSLSASIGDGSWDLTSLVTPHPIAGAFDSLPNHAVLIDGGLSNALGISVLLQDFAVGELSLGNFACNSSLECFTQTTGTAFDIISGSAGTINSVSVDVEVVELTPSEQIAELQEDVEILGISDALLEAVEAKLEAQSGNNNAAVNMLEAFINSIDARRNNTLTDVQADDLITRAQAIIDALEVMGSE